MRITLVFLALLLTTEIYSQLGGNSVFQILKLSPSAKITALGGEQITNTVPDISMAISNPALLNKNIDNTASLNYVRYFADISNSNLMYVREIKSFGMASATFNYLNYGKFTRTDASGEILGEFIAADYFFQMGASKTLDSLYSIGVNLKTMSSNLESNVSSAIAADVGGNYNSRNGLFTAAILLKNIGTQFQSYNEKKEPLPFEIQAGISQKLAHAPFRFSLTLTNLQKFDLSYRNSNLIKTNPITNQEIISDLNFGEKLFQHAIIGVEFIPSEIFNVQIGYNYRKRYDLRIEDDGGFVGFSWGFGVKIANFKIDYGNSTYHLAGSSNFISISKQFGKN